MCTHGAHLISHTKTFFGEIFSTEIFSQKPFFTKIRLVGFGHPEVVGRVSMLLVDSDGPNHFRWIVIVCDVFRCFWRPGGCFKAASESSSFGILPAGTLAGVPAAHLGACKTCNQGRMARVWGPPWSYFDRCGSAGNSGFCTQISPQPSSQLTQG